MVTLPPWPVSTDFGTCSYQCFLSKCTPVSLHMLKCSCAHTLSCLFMYCSFASIIILLLLLLLLLSSSPSPPRLCRYLQYIHERNHVSTVYSVASSVLTTCATC